jgi:branched-subunit amino acid ABC-type transport system permease component
MQSDEALILVRELGVANFGTGFVGVLSLIAPSFVLPVAISAGIFYEVAGIRHVLHHDRSRNETIAMVSDLGIALVLAAFVQSTELRIGGYPRSRRRSTPSCRSGDSPIGC